MNNSEQSGKWEDQKKQLKEKFAALNESDLLFAKDKKEEMISKLQIKLGKTREEILKIIDSL
ncbi:hypothetical protein [Flavobacterium sp. W20_MBD1_R3]|uniref:hypothetical protein n=1 Tax=Flavobacterium sp. W20_MBD1_R3 TaxID=3240278 RepID=UPI003F902162